MARKAKRSKLQIPNHNSHINAPEDASAFGVIPKFKFKITKGKILAQKAKIKTLKKL